MLKLDVSCKNVQYNESDNRILLGQNSFIVFSFLQKENVTPLQGALKKLIFDALKN